MGWETDDDKDFVNPPPRKRPRGTGKFSGKISKKRLRKRWWKIRPSRVPRDSRFEDKDLGDGVFTRRKTMKKKIYFTGGVHQSKTNMTSQQIDYGVQSDYPNYCFTPTDEDITNNKLHMCWKINHNCRNPTHRLYWSESTHEYPYGRPYLVPLRIVKINEELSYDYNNK